MLGENFPLVSLKGGRRPIVLGFGSQVYGRFSLTDPKSALISTDWVVGVNTTAVLNSWALTLEVYHESSHLGDEYGNRFPTDRLDWTREVLAGWASYAAGVWRFTGGASYVLDDQLRLPAPAGRSGWTSTAGHAAPWPAQCARLPVSSSRPTRPPAGG